MRQPHMRVTFKRGEPLEGAHVFQISKNDAPGPIKDNNQPVIFAYFAQFCTFWVRSQPDLVRFWCFKIVSGQTNRPASEYKIFVQFGKTIFYAVILPLLGNFSYPALLRPDLVRFLRFKIISGQTDHPPSEYKIFIQFWK